MAVANNTTLLTTADAATGFLSGGADTELFVEGSGSIGQKMGGGTTTQLYNNGSTINMANGHLLSWKGVLTPGKMNSLAAGGLAIRATGSSTADFLEWYVSGSDVNSGGFKQYVQSVEAATDASGGTAATTALQHFGLTYRAGSGIMGNFNNVLQDRIVYLPSATPGLLVTAGTSGTPITFSDVESFTNTNGLGLFFLRDGVYFSNVPIRIGAATGTHFFTESTNTLAWEDHDVAADYYGIDLVGTVTLDLSSVVISSSNARWFLDASDAAITAVNLTGCTLVHADTIDLTSTSDVITVDGGAFVDCGIITLDNNNTIQNATIDNAYQAAANDPALLLPSTNYTLSNVTFKNNDVAVEIKTAGIYTFDALFFDSNTTDVAVSATSGTVTINIVGGGTPALATTTAGATIVVNANTQVTLSGLVNPTEVRVYTTTTTTELAGIENVTTGSFSFSLGAGTVVDIRIHATAWNSDPILGFTIPNSDTTIPISQRVDRTYINP